MGLAPLLTINSYVRLTSSGESHGKASSKACPSGVFKVGRITGGFQHDLTVADRKPDTIILQFNILAHINFHD